MLVLRVALSLVVASLFTMACSPSDPATRVRWSAVGEGKTSPLPQHIRQAIESRGNSKDSIQTFNVGTESIRRWPQKIAGVDVANSWYQVVDGSTGGLVYFTGKSYGDITLDLQQQIKSLDQNKDVFVSRYRARNRDLASAKTVYPAKIALQDHVSGLRPVLQVSYVTAQEDDVIQVKFGPNGQLLSKQSVAHHLSDGITSVYPSLPTQTSLTEVILKELVGNGTLANNQLKVNSALGESVFNPNNDFRYPPNHPSFSETQSFYYVNSALGWFRDNFDFSLPFYLNVKVHVGGTDPSNAAFYYNGSIRLGEGDGVVYKNLVHDPTIVMHEAAHAVIDAVADLPSRGEGGALNEGYADFFAACMANTPYMGSYAYQKAPYKRSLENRLVAYKDFTSGKYHNSTIVSGTLWDIKQRIGVEKAAALALSSLARLGPGGQFSDFAAAIQDAMLSQLEGDAQKQVNEALAQRGWIQHAGSAN